MRIQCHQHALIGVLTVLLEVTDEHDVHLILRDLGILQLGDAVLVEDSLTHDLLLQRALLDLDLRLTLGISFLQLGVIFVCGEHDQVELSLVLCLGQLVDGLADVGKLHQCITLLGGPCVIQRLLLVGELIGIPAGAISFAGLGHETALGDHPHIERGGGTRCLVGNDAGSILVVATRREYHQNRDQRKHQADELFHHNRNLPFPRAGILL